MQPLLGEEPDVMGASSPETLRVIARLKPGVDADRARALLGPLAARLTMDKLPDNRATSFRLESRATAVHFSREAVMVMFPILIAFLLVLLTACANIANMMLARALALQREMGIRLSLGAARPRLIRQLLTESVLLALPGALAGFVISLFVIGFGSRAMMAVLPAEFLDYVRVLPLQPDIRVFAFMTLAAIASGIIFGLVPAFQATRIGIVRAARGDFRHQFRPGPLRDALVVLQIVVCSLFLICAGALLRQANSTRNRDIGIRTRDVISLQLQDRSRDRILAALDTEAFVRKVAASSASVLNGGFPSALVSTPRGRLTTTSYNYVSPEFFDVLDIPLLRGRNFSRDESLAGAPVAIVSETLARELWPDEEAIGQTLRLMPDSRSHQSLATPLRQPAVQVIGVARDMNNGFADTPIIGRSSVFPLSLGSAPRP